MLQKYQLWPLKALLLVIKIIPIRLIYFCSFFPYCLLYHVLRYRRALIHRQLSDAFPEKTPASRHRLQKKIYRHLTDLIIESLKGFTFNSKQLQRRWRVINPEILTPHNNHSVIIVSGHAANWEWGVSLNHQIKHHAISFYKPLRNKTLNDYLLKCRKQGGNEMHPGSKAHRVVFKNNHRGCAFTFIADQHPVGTHHIHWTKFLNQDTATLMGPEIYAAKLNCPVFYSSIKKERRGYYTVTLVPICKQPKLTKKGEITEQFMKALEADILQQPELWLWSHNRWKLKRHQDQTTTNQSAD